MRRITSILFILLVILQIKLQAQAHSRYSKHNLMAGVKVEYGFLASHHLELDAFQSHFPAFELSFEKQTWGKQRWEVIYGYPIIGLATWYSPIGGFDEIGYAIALYPFVDFPIVQDLKQSFNFRMGVGLGYLSNYFNNKDNYKNFAIGSHINVAGRLYFEYRRKISPSVTLSGGIGLTHFSNGSMKTPNYGLNLVTATIGTSIFLKRPNPQLSSKLLPRLYIFEFDGKKSLDFDAVFFLGFKDMSQEFGKKFMVYAFTAEVFKQVSWKSKFGLGFDLTYDASDRYILAWAGTPVENDWQLFKPGLSAAYQLVFSRLSFVFNFGFYLYELEKSEGQVYQRLGMRYEFTDHLFASVAVNTNWGKAEYIGFGIGYRLDFIYKRTVRH